MIAELSSQTEPIAPKAAPAERAVDHDINTATQPCRDKLVNSGVDGRIFASDTHTGHETGHSEAGQIP